MPRVQLDTAYSVLIVVLGIASERTGNKNSDQHGEKVEQGRAQRINVRSFHRCLTRNRHTWGSNCTITLAIGSIGSV